MVGGFQNSISSHCPPASPLFLSLFLSLSHSRSLSPQCHTKQMEGEELRLELANQKRSWSSEERGLRQRLVAVEMELEEVRREKEEYQKGSILNNLETVALGNQVMPSDSLPQT